MTPRGGTEALAALRPVTPLTALGALGDSLTSMSGESSGIHPLGPVNGVEGLLFKQYLDRERTEERTRSLDALITLVRSERESLRADRDVLLRGSSWPLTRVIDASGSTVGCLMRSAPGAYRLPNGGKLREIDQLARTDEQLRRRGVTVTAEQRLLVCRDLARFAAVLERRRLLYIDWNYANALWSDQDWTALVIDVDGCRTVSQPGEGVKDRRQPNWEEMVARSDGLADRYTDRFRVALLVARCLTGQRELPQVLRTLAHSGDDQLPARETLLAMLAAADRTRRPNLDMLRSALGGSTQLRFDVPLVAIPAAPPPKRRVVTTPKTPEPADKVPAPNPWAPPPVEPRTPTPIKEPGKSAGPAVVIVALIVFVILVIIATHTN
jgi:hypothetical protein